MNEIVGIDLGTTNSAIGIMEGGVPVLLADDAGARLTPSVVYFPAEGEPLVGAPAARMRALAPERTIYSIKRFIGRRGEEISDKESEMPYRITRRQGAAARVLIGECEYSAEAVSAEILRKLKQDAAKSLGREVSRAVITVPAYFNDGQRKATQSAGELAGFNVERIVNEPTAAALAYGFEKRNEGTRIAVYDLGGGTFDISLLELSGGVFEVLATHGNTRLGGDDIDRALLDHVLAAQNISGLAVSAQQMERLRERVIAAKHDLSSVERVVIDLPFFRGSEHLFCTFTREELERIARPIVERTRAHCRRALADAKLAPGEIDEVIVVGGATRMPLVRQTVAEIFGREPNLSQNPDESIALGATIQGGISSGAVQNVILLDVTPLSLGIETFGGLMNVIIPRNSTIPIKAGEMFTTAVSNQRAMTIKVLQGEREMARDNWSLGQFELEFEPAPKGVPRIGVQFEIDASGILHVLARDTRTGGEKVMEMQSAVDVSDEAVEAMLADSLEHAFEDVSERRWTEAQLKAGEMLRSCDQALALLGAEIRPEEKRAIEEAAENLRRALDTRELSKLQKAIAALDQATQGLAAEVVEKLIPQEN